MKRKRVGGIIILDNKLAVIYRRKKKEDKIIEYYTIPGGGVEDAETTEEALKRELKEELNIEVDIEKHLFNIETEKNIEYFYLCKYLSGNFTLNGEELDRINEDNYYEPTFISISDIEKYDILDSIKEYFTKKCEK